MPHHPCDFQVKVPIGRGFLQGTLRMPHAPRGVVIFAHGSGSGRFSPRNLAVAQALFDQRCGTFLFDLLDQNESQDRRNVFDIQLLAQRVSLATDRLMLLDEMHDLPLGYFGASTGAAAALVAAAERGDHVAATVSRGGRPDLAGPSLPFVKSPTLLLVGSFDIEVIALNRQAHQQMTCENHLSLIPGATHLFEEPGTLEAVSHQAAQWFIKYFQ